MLLRRRLMCLSDSQTRPNKSPEPTAVGPCSSAIAVHVTSRRWLSFFSLGALAMRGIHIFSPETDRKIAWYGSVAFMVLAWLLLAGGWIWIVAWNRSEERRVGQE